MNLKKIHVYFYEHGHRDSGILMENIDSGRILYANIRLLCSLLNQSTCLYIYIKFSFYLSYSTSIVQRDAVHTNSVRITKSAIPSFTASLRALTEVVKMDSAFLPNHARWTQNVDSPSLALTISIWDTKLVSTIWTLGTPCVTTGTGSRCTIQSQTRVRLFTTVLTTDEIIYDL